MNTAKQEKLTFGQKLFGFFEQQSLDYFNNIKCQWDFNFEVVMTYRDMLCVV